MLSLEKTVVKMGKISNELVSHPTSHHDHVFIPDIAFNAWKLALFAPIVLMLGIQSGVTLNGTAVIRAVVEHATCS